MSSAVPVLTLLLHRHGMRHPFVFFEGIGEPVKPDQLALLTERGQKQMTALGKHLAKKHGLATRNASDDRAAFLASQMISAEVFSSSVQRCIDSAQIVFKNFLGQDIEPKVLKVDYGAFYYEMIPRNLPKMLASSFETAHSKTVGDYINYLNDKINSTETEDRLRYQIVEAWLTAHMNGHPLPSYTDLETLERCLHILHFTLIQGFKEKLAAEILEDLEKRLEVFDLSSTNYVAFSVSDIHVCSVLELLCLPLEHWPDYGTAFELHFFKDGSVILDELRNNPEAEIQETLGLRETTIDKVKTCLAKALQQH